MAFLRDVWNFDNNVTQPLFYDSFSSLNHFLDTTNLTPEMFQKIQIANLKKAYANKDAYKELNNFIQNVLGETQGTENDLFAKLAQGINEGLDEWRSAANKINPNWIKEREEYYSRMNQILDEINLAVNKASGEEGIPAPTLDALQNRIRQHMPGKAGKQDYIQAKGDYLEELGKWLIIRAGLAGFQTGAWQAIDKFFDEDTNASIIEDAMGYVTGGKNQILANPSENIIQLRAIGFKDANEKTRKKKNKQLQKLAESIMGLNGIQVADGYVTVASNISSIEDFVNIMNLINNSLKAEAGIQIVFSDNLYDQIHNLSVNIQAKSNIARHLANEGNRSLYSIKSSSLYDKWVEFSQTKPVLYRQAVSEEEFNAPHEEFAAYVNFNLSKEINNTVYGRNEYYLTTEGFTDLATLMAQRGFCIRIADSMVSYKQFLDNKYKTIYSSF